MPALGMEIHITGLDESKVKINKLKAGLETGMGPALVEIGELGSKYFGGVAFQAKGSAFGEPWEPLASVTVRDKAKNWPGRPDMVRTGQMSNSFTYEVLDGYGVRLYNDDPKFVYHQSAAARKKLPRRVMIGVNLSLQSMIEQVIRKQVIVIINEATS